MKNYVVAEDVVQLTAPSGGVVGGTPVKIGSLIVIPEADTAVGLSFAANTNGVFVVPKATGQAWTEGVKLYWDNTAFNFTTTSTSNTLCGYAVAAALSADTTGTVLLQQVGG